jgi:hypothetical protein
MKDKMENSPAGSLKELRRERKPQIEAAMARVREQRKDMDKIRDQIRAEGRTVPEIAMNTGLPSPLVMWYIASLKKYGQAVEGEKDGSCFRYRLAAEERDAVPATFTKTETGENANG